MQDMVTESMRREWWTLVVKGVVAILFGFAAIIWPGLTIGVLALLLAALIGVYGIFDIISGIRNIFKMQWTGFLTLLLGLFEAGVTVYLFRHAGRGLAIGLLVLLIVFTFIVKGVISVVAAFGSDYSNATRWMLAIVGLVSIGVGIVIASYPQTATLAFVWVLGLYALIAGPIEIALGLMAKEAIDELDSGKKRR